MGVLDRTRPLPELVCQVRGIRVSLVLEAGYR